MTASGWTRFCDALDLGALVPESLARYRPAVVDALAFFLSELPATRSVEILAAQMGLPTGASLAQRLITIARHCPALHKLAQVLARDRRLPAALREQLQGLETMRPTWPRAVIAAALERELGPLKLLGVRLTDEPLAEASVAIVTPFSWRTQGEWRRGVFKVLKSGIEERLDQDLALLARIASRLDEQCHRFGLPPIDYSDAFARVRELLALEVRLDREQAHLAAARPLYQALASVIIPEVYPFCTPRVTAMERIDGRRVTDAALPPASRHRLAALVVEAEIAQPLWAPAETALFHADPHAGNLLVTPDGRLALLDWSLAGHLTKQDRVQLTQVLLGAVALDERRIVDAIAGLASQRPDAERLHAVVQVHLRHLRRGQPLGLTWLTGLLDQTVTAAGVRFAPDLTLLRRVIHMVQGVVADISASTRIDAVLASSFLRCFADEWGTRLLASPFARDFSTHLSNVDIAQLFLDAPLIATRYWLGLQQDLLRAERGPRSTAAPLAAVEQIDHV